MPSLLNHQKLLSTNFLTKLLILITMILSLVLGLIIPNQFMIKQVDIKPEGKSIIGAKELIGQNLFFLSISRTINDLLANNPDIEQFNLTKHYPNRLKITYTKSKIVAQIKTNGQYLLLSPKAKIVNQQKNPKEDLLMINYYQNIRAFEARPGQTIINQDLLYSVRLVTEAKSQGFRLETITVNKPGQIVVRLKTRKTLITFSSKKNIAKNWRIVHNILRSLKIKGQSPKEINLLFDKPYFVL